MDLRNKSILVTGSEGFIGSHLTETLVSMGAKVRALVLYNSLGSWGWLDFIENRLKSSLEVVSGDLRDYSNIEKICKGIDYIFHLGALIAIPYSYHSPESYVATNVTGTLNILQAARKCDVKRVLVTSTSEVYGSACYVPIDEKHPLQAQSPYSATKIAADRIAESFYKSFDQPITIVRPFNTYGPRQSARAIIPTIIVQLLSGSLEIKLGSLSPRRDLVYVSDTVKGFVEILKSPDSIGEEINIATGKDISVGDLAQILIKRINPRAKIIEDKVRLRPNKSEVMHLNGDNTKLKRLTGWQPSVPIDKGLAATIEWLESNMRFYKHSLYNI